MQEHRASRHRLTASQFGLGSLMVLLTVLSVVLAAYARYYFLGVVCLAMLAGAALVAFGAARKRTRLLGFGALVAIASLVLLIVGGSRALWIGQSLVTLTFVVVDEQTGQPVPAATLRLRELPFQAGLPSTEIARGEAGVEARTDARGRVSVTYKFTTSGQSRLLVRDTAAAVMLDHFFVQVSAPSYATRVVPLDELAGHTIDIAWPLEPPPVVFRLKRDKVSSEW